MIHNQHWKSRIGLSKDAYISILYCIIFILLLAVIGMKIQASRVYLSPVPERIRAYSTEESQLVVDRAKAKYELETLKKDQEAGTTANIVAYIVKVFGVHGKKTVREALDIAFCESGWRAEAYNFNSNKTGDYGPFQVNSVHIKRYGDGFTKSWKANVDVAYSIYNKQGWNPWVCAKKLGL